MIFYGIKLESSIPGLRVEVRTGWDRRLGGDFAYLVLRDEQCAKWRIRPTMIIRGRPPHRFRLLLHGKYRMTGDLVTILAYIQECEAQGS